MCYSAEASLGSFLISLFGFILLYLRNYKNDRLIGLVIFGVSIMQLGELLIHLDLECKTGVNKIGSSIGLLSHSLIQPLFSFISILLFSSIKLDPKLKIFWALVIFISFSSSLFYWPENKDLCSYKYNYINNKTSHQLYWPWFKSINIPLYGSLVFILPILFSDLKYKIFWLLYSMSGPIILTYLYPKTSSSLWCFFAPAITIILKLFLY